MKLLSFTANPPDTTRGSQHSDVRIGILQDDGLHVVDLVALHESRGAPAPAWSRDMLALLDWGDAAQTTLPELLQPVMAQPPDAALRPLAGLNLLAPLPRPRSLRDCMVFERHLIQATRTAAGWRSPLLARLDRWSERLRRRPLIPVPRVWYEQPLYYKGNPASVVGPETEIRWPSFTEKLDFELEMAIFIGRRGCDISIDQALDYVAGYTIFNDFSARDMQMREMAGRLGPAKSKDFDTSNALGPYLVTRDEIPDPRALACTAGVDGEPWSQSSMAAMHFGVAEIIAHVSRDETLYPGDVIGTGTVPDGCGMELDRWLRPGNVVELEITGLGILRNRIVRTG